MGLLRKIIFLVLFVIAIVSAFFIKQGYDLYTTALAETPIEEKIKEIESIDNYTLYSELPEEYVNAVLAVEDTRFFEHSGINPISIARALIIDIKEKSFEEGGSTITQQLAKNIYFTQEKNITRKVAEVFMALKLEEALSKEGIFELYVNSSYFGNGYYCVKDASNGYFGKNPSEMDAYESTLLAGIPNAPSVYAPTKNPDLAKQRQKQVIKKMIKYGYLTEEEASKIISNEE